MRRLAWLVALFAVLAPIHALADVQVTVAGAVVRPGAQSWPEGSRFSAAVLAATPTEEAYPLGASVLRAAELPAQRALKAGVLYDLNVIATAPDVAAPLAVRAAAIHDWIDALPVTGRVRADLQPRRLEVDAGGNRVLADGDRFQYPRRPDTVRVVGAVPLLCTLPHVPLRNARDYLRECAVDSGAADRDFLLVVQPDGEVQRLGIAAWNRSAAQALAPGAVLYVPLDEAASQSLAPGLNDELAAFLATQPLPVDAP